MVAIINSAIIPINFPSIFVGLSMVKCRGRGHERHLDWCGHGPVAWPCQVSGKPRYGDVVCKWYSHGLIGGFYRGI